MANNVKIGYRLYGFLKLVPALWIFSIFITYTPYLSFVRYVDSETWFTSVAFWLGGFAFIAEGIILFPKNNRGVGLSSSILMLVLGVINTAIGLLIFFDLLELTLLNHDWVLSVFIVLGISGFMLLVTGLYEMYAGSHTVKSIVKKSR